MLLAAGANFSRGRSAHWPVKSVTGRGMAGGFLVSNPIASRCSSPAPRLHLLEAEAHRLDGGMAELLLLDDEPLHGADRVGCGEDLAKVHGAAAQLLLVLEVHERYPGAVVAYELRGRIPGEVDPVDVHLCEQVSRLGRAQDPVERWALVEHLEFAVVVVEPEADAERAERFAHLAQLLADPLAGRSRDVVLRRPPGADDIAGAEEERVADDRVGVASNSGVADVHARDLEARGVERGLCALGVKIAVSGEFDAGVADPGNCGGGGCEIPLCVLADGPELKGDRDFFHR